MKNLMDVTEKERKLLYLIYSNKSIRTKDLCRLAGLKVSNCYDIVNRLVKRGVVRKEMSANAVHKGRPSEDLVLNYSYLSCFLIFLSKTVSFLAVTDLKGNMLVRKPYLFDENVTLDKFVNDAVQFLRGNDGGRICCINAVLGSNPQNQNSTGMHPSFTNEGLI
ncbi:MAG: winged helix-turn-helix domain-containing protein, partial [Spirochaetales bacterium]|nr:winged helix-turn-helix domain-containing protein [Spirochaetales bacterium]